jgi:hypothetical protein
VPLKVLSKSTKPIPVSNLLEYCTDHRQDGNKGFAEEFKVFKHQITTSSFRKFSVLIIFLHEN